MKQTVYVVSEGADHEGGGVVAVFNSLEDAQEYKHGEASSSYARLNELPWRITRDEIGGGIVYWERRNDLGVYVIIEPWEVQ